MICIPAFYKSTLSKSSLWFSTFQPGHWLCVMYSLSQLRCKIIFSLILKKNSICCNNPELSPHTCTFPQLCHCFAHLFFISVIVESVQVSKQFRTNSQSTIHDKNVRVLFHDKNVYKEVLIKNGGTERKTLQAVICHTMNQ